MSPSLQKKILVSKIFSSNPNTPSYQNIEKIEIHKRQIEIQNIILNWLLTKSENLHDMASPLLCLKWTFGKLNEI